MKQKKFRNSGSVPFLFDLCFLSKYKKIQFVIIITPSNIYPKGDFPKLFDFPQTEYGDRKIIEVNGSYHYRDLAIAYNIIPQSKVDQYLLPKAQFYHHLPARYRNCGEIMDFIKFVSKNTFESKLNDNMDKPVDRSKLPSSYQLPNGLKPVIWIQALKEPDFKDFKALIDFLEKSSQSKLKLSKESVTVITPTESVYKKLLKSVLELKNENEEKKSEMYQYLMNKSKRVQQNLKAKDEKFAQWNHSLEPQINGAENDIVVYVTDFYLYLPAITRSRKQLIVITYGKEWQEENREKNSDCLPMMEKAVDKNLVTKFSS